MSKEKPSSHLRNLASHDRRFAIIAAVATLDKPSLKDIEDATGIPGISIRRLLISIRNDYGLDLIFVRGAKEPGSKPVVGNRGYYTIQQWGILDKKEFLKTYVYA